MLFDFVDEWISVWTSGFEKSLVHLTSGSESLAKPLIFLINLFFTLALWCFLIESLSLVATK